MRIRWYRRPLADKTCQSSSFPYNPFAPRKIIPKSSLADFIAYPEAAPPVFCGHYWLIDETDIILFANAACLNLSIAKQGKS